MLHSPPEYDDAIVAGNSEEHFSLNKTLKSYIFAIVGAEYVLRWLPIGTHEWEKFVDPNSLINISKKYSLELDSLDGMKFNLLKDEWKVSKDKSINYIGKFIKN